MENLLRKVSSQTTALIAFFLILLSLLALGVFKLNLGPDFRSSQVVIAQVDHAVSTDNMAATVSAILKPSQIEKESTGKFYFYFQNVTAAQLSTFTTQLKKAVPGVLSTNIFELSYAGEQYIGQRLLILAVVGCVLYLGYLAWMFKPFAFKRFQIVQYLLAEFLILTFSVLVLLGAGSILGKLGLSLDIIFWDIFMLGVAVVLVFRAYTLLRLRDYVIKEQTRDFFELYQKMHQKYWPEFVFIFCLGIIVSLLPWLVSGTHLLLSSIMVLVAVLVAFFNFSLLEPYFLQFLGDWSILKPKAAKSKHSVSFWEKQW